MATVFAVYTHQGALVTTANCLFATRDAAEADARVRNERAAALGIVTRYVVREGQ